MATFIFKRKEYVAPLLIAGANVAGGALGFMVNFICLLDKAIQNSGSFGGVRMISHIPYE